MRNHAIALMFIVLCLGAGPLRAGDEPYDGAQFKRVTLVVADLERSLQVYRDILGFELDGVMDPNEIEASSGESYSYPVFKIDPTARIRFATLSAGEAQVRTLGITEVTGIELPKPGRPLMTATVIRVNDLDGTMKRIAALGLETVDPTIAERPGEFRFKEQAFIDFDGHLIVLYQMLPLGED